MKLHLVFFTLLAAGLFFSSCKQKTTNECAACKTVPPTRFGEVEVGTYKLQADIWKDADANYLYARSKTEEDVAGILSQIVFYQNPNASDIAAIALYLNGELQTGDQIAKDRLLGYGVYYHRDNQLRYQFFLRENGAYHLIPELDCEARKLSTNDMYNTVELYFLNNEAPTTGYVIMNNDVFFRPNESKSHTMGYNLKYLLRKKQGNPMAKSTRPPTKCKIPCSGGEHECEETLHGLSCDKTSEEENDVAQATYALEELEQPASYVDSVYDI